MQEKRGAGTKRRWNGLVMAATAVAFAGVLAACGGSGGSSDGNVATPPASVAAPSVVTQPQSVRVADGQPAGFTIAVVSATTPGYQWSRSGTAIPGATAASYTVPTAQLSDDGATFAVTVTNGGGSVQSVSATLNVSPVAPGIANNGPTSLSVIAGQPASFTVTATGSLPLTFQWRRGGVAIAGATSATYTIPATATSDNGATFDVVVTNVAGTVTSAIFTLTVTAQVQAPSITTQPQPVSVRAGNPATFTVTAGGTAPFGYQWSRDGTAIAGAQAASYTVSTTTLADSGAQFAVTVANAAGSVASGQATLTVTPQASLALVAGSIGGSGTIDGVGTAARLASPAGVAVDNGGTVYIADATTVRKLTASGVVTTFAGSATATGSADGAGSAALFGSVAGVAVDPSGNVFVVDGRNGTIRKITPAGVVTTFAGQTGVAGSADGQGTAATFNVPSGIATDAAGNVYVADSGNQTIRKITAAGAVSTLAGNAGVSGSSDGTGGGASFSGPSGIATDAASNVYVADSTNAIIRRITPAGVVTTIAGTAGVRGSADGAGAAASFNSPSGIAVDGAGIVYVGDGTNRTIRRITTGGVVTTIAGTPGVAGAADGTGAAASFSGATSLASTSGGVLYVADRDNFEVRSVSTTAVVTTVAGAAPVRGSADGTGSAAMFGTPYGIAIDAARTLYVADTGVSTLRKITAGGVVTTLAGRAGVSGSADGFGAAANFGAIRGLAVNAAGTIYVADFSNNTVRAITPAGNVTTLAGNPSIGGSSDATGAAATFNGPSGVAVDAGGNLFVTDTINGTIRRITPAGVVTTFAGTAGRPGALDGTGAAASFNLPTGITIDASGNLYVADTGNATIRKITAAGVVTTVAGIAGRTGSADGAALGASFNAPVGIAIDAAGNLFVADTGNRTIRRIDAFGAVTTFAGVADGRKGVRLGALPGALNQPLHLAIDSAGSLYLTDVNAVLTITQS